MSKGILSTNFIVRILFSWYQDVVSAFSEDIRVPEIPQTHPDIKKALILRRNKIH